MKGTYRTLFAKTGNQCAFPDCYHPLIDEDHQFVAQICHIEAASTDGERYNEQMTDEERRAPENLIVLCYRHHVKTNNVNVYPVEVLRGMKKKHEALYSERKFTLKDEEVNKIIKSELNFWDEVKKLNKDSISQQDMTRRIMVTKNPIRNIDYIYDDIKWLNKRVELFEKFFNELPLDISKYLESIGYNTQKYDDASNLDNPFHNCFWEMINIGFQNCFQEVEINLQIVDLYLSFQELKNSPKDQTVVNRIDKVKKQLKREAKHGMYVD